MITISEGAIENRLQGIASKHLFKINYIDYERNLIDTIALGGNRKKYVFEVVEEDGKKQLLVRTTAGYEVGRETL